MSKRVESLIRTIGYAILLSAVLALAWSVKAQSEVNREARLQKWTLISMEIIDSNNATKEWNDAVKRYKTLDDINAWELLNAIRKNQVALAKTEEYLMTLDEASYAVRSGEVKMNEFRCKCGVLVITNDQNRRTCVSCESKEEAKRPDDDYPPDRFSDH